MKKYIFTESQLKRIIDGVITEQTALDPRTSPETAWNKYLRSKQASKGYYGDKTGGFTAQNFLDFLSQKGISQDKIPEYLRQQNARGSFSDLDIATFLTDLGWDERSIKKLRLRPRKVNTNAASSDVTTNGGATQGSGLGSTGQAHIPHCAGGGCLKEETKNVVNKVLNLLR